ncbi:MAG: PIN domain-containing protein [Nitrososphaerales archaeon]
MADVLLDTTFLLPTLGIEVSEITQKDFEALKRISETGTKLYCSYFSFVEIFGKLARATRGREIKSVKDGIKSLLESNAYSWIAPSAEALQLALELRLRGHKDNIDNMLYSIALSSNMFFLSLDSELRRFLEKNGYNKNIVVGVSELSHSLRRGRLTMPQ